MGAARIPAAVSAWATRRRSSRATSGACGPGWARTTSRITASAGPIVSTLVQKLPGRLHVPVTIVPGILSDEEIDAIS